MEGFRRCSEGRKACLRVSLKSWKRGFWGKKWKRGVGAENEMGWRGKYRDSSESAGGPRKKETPKVSGDGPCSLNIRSNPPAQPPFHMCGVEVSLLGWWKLRFCGVVGGVLSPRGVGGSFLSFLLASVLLLITLLRVILILLLYLVIFSCRWICFVYFVHTNWVEDFGTCCHEH